jgi:hypothetical protein
MNLISKLFNTRPPLEEDILNQGLIMAMEFGENWLQPISERLKLKFIHLSDNQINTYSLTCRKAMDQGHRFIMTSLTELTEEGRTIKDSDFKGQFNNYVKTNLNWINEANLRQLYSQGLYYAWKEGLDKVIID